MKSSRLLYEASRVAAAPLAEAIRRRFRPLGGVELRVPDRQPVREPPKPGKAVGKRRAA